MAFGKLADLFVEVGVKDETARGLGRIRSMLGGWAGDARRALTLPVSIAGAIGGAALGKFLWDSVQAAGNLSETLSKVGVTFGNSANQVISFADDMADSFGLVKQEVLDAASAFGLILQGSGMTAEASAGLSIQLAKLAADAASFYNVPVAEALDKIRAGLVGESEPLRAFGVLLSEAAVQAKAADMGFTQVGGKFTEAAKSASRAQLIMEGLGKASGDLDRTSDSLSNRQKKLAGDFKNLQAEIGSALIDPMRELIDLVYDLGDALDGTFSGDRAASMAKMGAGVSGAISNVSDILLGSNDKTQSVMGGQFEFDSNMLTRFVYDTAIEAAAALGFEGPRREEMAKRMAEKQARTAGGDPNKASQAYLDAVKAGAAEAAPEIASMSGAEASKRLRGMEDFGIGMTMGQMAVEDAIMRGAAQDYAARGIGGELKGERSRLADMEQGQRDRLARGGVLGDQLSSISSMQDELLNDLPRQQLEEQKKTVKTLGDILTAIEAGDMGAVGQAEAILAE
jgi:hypothetical protein